MIFVKNNMLKLSIIIYLSLISCGCNVITKKDTSNIKTSKQIMSMITRTVDYGDNNSDKNNLHVSNINANYFINNKMIYIQIIYHQDRKIGHAERITVLMKGRYVEDSDISNITSYIIRVQMRPQAGRPGAYKVSLTEISDVLYLSAILKLTQFDIGLNHKVTLDITNVRLKKAQSLNTLTGLLIPYDREVAKKYFRGYLEI